MGRTAGIMFGVVVAAGMLAGCFGSNIRTFRYRLTVEVEQEGRPQTASSIIEAHYILGNRDGNGLRWHWTIMGTAPILDLGLDGTLIAAFDYDAEDLQKRQTLSKRWPPYRMPFDFAGIPLGAYHLAEPDTIETMRGVAVLDPKYYPIFVWIPPSGNWREARQMFHDEIATRATPRLRATKISVESTPNEPLTTTVEPAPPWMAELKDYEKSARQGIVGRYYFSSWRIERGSLK